LFTSFHLASLKEFMEFFPLEQRFGLTRDFMQRAAAWTRSMSAEEKESVCDAFGDAAARAGAAGFDAVELHGATGYLLTQFLSGFSHKDASGTAVGFEDRIRFPLQVVREVKRRLPSGFLVGFRLLLREWVPGGIDLDEALAFAEALASEGVGYLSPSVGTYHSISRRARPGLSGSRSGQPVRSAPPGAIVHDPGGVQTGFSACASGGGGSQSTQAMG
jgi:2,4-dienoyl-CoA reductase-like NADH-dependent reductase (Old Yellow Enzyme family)